MKTTLQLFAKAITAFGITLTLTAPVSAADTVSKELNHAAKTDYTLTVQQAEANYKTEKARCDTLQGNKRDVCMKSAQAAYDITKAEAKADRKTVGAYATEDEERRDSNYKVAKEKCKQLSGADKDACVERAKADYAQ